MSLDGDPSLLVFLLRGLSSILVIRLFLRGNTLIYVRILAGRRGHSAGGGRGLSSSILFILRCFHLNSFSFLNGIVSGAELIGGLGLNTFSVLTSLVLDYKEKLVTT